MAGPLTAIDDPSGKPLPGKQVAQRLARDLRKVQVVGKHRKNPVGWVIVVNVDVSGLRDVPLFLVWSLDGLDVPVSWGTGNVAYRMTATTDHDTGSFKVWVPRLRGKHLYNVNIELVQASDGIILTQGEPLPVR